MFGLGLGIPGGGRSSASEQVSAAQASRAENVTVQWTIDLEDVPFADGSLFDHRWYYLRASQYNDPALQQFIRESDIDPFLTVDWGDATGTEVIRHTGWNGLPEWYYLLPGDSEGKTNEEFLEIYGDGTTKWSGGDQGTAALTEDLGYANQANGGYGWRHQYVAAGEYTIIITGPRAIVQCLTPKATDFNVTWGFTASSSAILAQYSPLVDQSLVNLGVTANNWYPVGPTKDFIYPSNCVVSAWQLTAPIRNYSSFSAGSNALAAIYDSDGGWDNMAKYPASLITFINNQYNSVESMTGIYHPIFWGGINATGAGLDLSGWDTSRFTNLGGAFYGCPSVPPGLSSWDTGNVTDLQDFHFVPSTSGPDTLPSAGFTGFNQDISGWNTSKVTSLVRFVGGNIGSTPHANNNSYPASWNLNSLTSARNMFRYNASLSDANLELILKGWANNANTADNVNASNFAAGRTYAAGSDMDTAITTLTNKGWTISGITIS